MADILIDAACDMCGRTDRSLIQDEDDDQALCSTCWKYGDLEPMVSTKVYYGERCLSDVVTLALPSQDDVPDQESIDRLIDTMADSWGVAPERRTPEWRSGFSVQVVALTPYDIQRYVLRGGFI